MKLRIFDATPKRTPGLSTNFSRQIRNFRCPALHFLSFVGKLMFAKTLHTPGPVNSIMSIWTLVVHRHRSYLCYIKSRIFNAMQKQTPRLSTNFLRQTRNFLVPCPSFSIVYRQIDIIEFTGPGVWSVSDKYQFADKRQKMKGRAPKVSCSSQKVGGKTWRSFWRSVKNAQFHPTKHLSQWVLKLVAEWYYTPSIFRLTDIFNLFVPGGPASSKMTTGAMLKHTYGQLSERRRKLRENPFSVPVWVEISK